MSQSITDSLSSQDGSRESLARTVHPFDRFVGDRIRQQRIMVGMSQQKLAELVGVTFQQIQKYERGDNRLGPRRLLMMASALGVPVTFLLNERAFAEYQRGGSAAELEDLVNSKDGTLLMRAFARIADRELRRSIIALVETLARTSEEPKPESR